MEIVSKTDIQEYAKRNTSPKMPIEKKYVEAYVDSMLNSTNFQQTYEDILRKTQYQDQFLIFNSYYKDAMNINMEPYQSILAYAMLKKDFFLFQLISHNCFTGSVEEFFGEDLFSDILMNTDESPLGYTDKNAFTDAGSGTIIVGFKNVYTYERLEDGSGSQYQTLNEYEDALNNFAILLTMVKPARTSVILFHIPYCFITGNGTDVSTINILHDSDLKSPFDNLTQVQTLKSLPIEQLRLMYRSVECVKPDGSLRDIDVVRTVKENSDNVVFSYEMRVSAAVGTTWDKIVIYSDKSGIDNIEFNIESYKPQEMSVYYFLRLDVKIPRNTN